ncbi:molybdopterin-dependent oxidoreductase [Chloroflexota bacterium]
MSASNLELVRGYCSQCTCWCPTVSYVRDGVFVEVRADREHPLAVPLCPKGLAGPELVYNKQRLKYPMRRTRPKGDPDPGWVHITWDEALNTIAAEMNEIKEGFGPEAVIFTRAGPGGSQMGELWPWMHRLADAFGTPNFVGTTHICNWHKDNASAYTYSNVGSFGSSGRAEFERAGCILIWGNNIHATRNNLLPIIKRGLDQGAKLIVVDPRRIPIADMADLWLQVQPGTDGALALSMLNVMIEENLFDYRFVADWTTAPFLVRNDTGNFLKASDLKDDGASSDYVIVDSAVKKPKAYTPGTKLPVEPALEASINLRLSTGGKVQCQTVFKILRDLVSQYHPSWAEVFTGVSADKIRDAVRMLANGKPACWYSWNGIEQNINATQTNRAICILYALTGDYDKPGGNVLPPTIARNSIDGREFLSPEVEGKRLGFNERPLGPGGITSRNTQGYELYQSILTGKPYPIKALVGFGGNTIISNAPSLLARTAISNLDFHVQIELFLSPTAELADIVLPAASSWESWHIGVNIAPLGNKAFFQLRPAVVPPQHEAWPDMKIMAELAKTLGLGNKFWNGDIKAGFDYLFAPSRITVEQLRRSPGGIITIDLQMNYQKYKEKADASNFLGFPTPSKRIEIYSQLFKDNGYDPLPIWREPTAFGQGNSSEKYPLILTGGKVVEYCHSQHRALPSLRRQVPHPFLEIHQVKAKELEVKDGDQVVLETPHGSITLRARITDTVPLNVVCAQNGWWQECLELNLPGYDPYSIQGANVNLLHITEDIDPISGSLPLKGYPSNVRKAVSQE